MNKLWITEDWHLWSSKPDKDHPNHTDKQLDTMSSNFNKIDSDDILIHLGDVTDPEVTDYNKLKTFIQNIKGIKILCKGNHETETDDYYLDAGFDIVTEIVTLYNIIFSHKPIKTEIDQLNIHGHLHTRIDPMLKGNYLNSAEYQIGKLKEPISLDDLLHKASAQTLFDKNILSNNKSYDIINGTDSYTQYHDISPMVESSVESLIRNPLAQNFNVIDVDDNEDDALGVYDLGESSKKTMDEIIFSDIDQVKYWLADDSKYEDEVTKAELDEAAVKSTSFNSTPYYVATINSMDDDLYICGNLLAASIEDAVRLVKREGITIYVHQTEPGYYSVRSSDENCGYYWSTSNINLQMIGKGIIQNGNFEWITEYPVDENVVINGKDIVVNFDKWKPEKNHNILFVTGLSGSGKTTLAEAYEKEYHAHMFELDGLEHGYDSSDMNILKQVRDKLPKYDEYLKSNKKIDKDNIHTLWNAIDAALDIMKSDFKTLYIVEGIQLYDGIIPDDQLIGKPLIIKNTSAIVSGIRVLQRTAKTDNISLATVIKNNLLQVIQYTSKSYIKFNTFKHNTQAKNKTNINEMAYEDYCDHFYSRLKTLAREYNKDEKIFKHLAKILDMKESDLPRFECKVQLDGVRQLCYSMIDPDVDWEIRAEYERTIKEIIKDLEKDNKDYPHVHSIWTADGEATIYINLDERIDENATPRTSLYHLSQKNLTGKTLTPKVPDNYFTKNGYEDGTTGRVCFAPSIDKALRALSRKCEGEKLYVHVPADTVKTKKPSTKEVPDSKITGEIWALEDVELKCIGVIKVLGDSNEPGMKFSYGNHTAELYDWNWKWIKKFSTTNESSITEIAHKWTNDKGVEVPKVCPKCGSKIKVFFHGEPVFLCSNKKCNKFFGVVPFNETATICNESVNSIRSKCNAYKELQRLQYIKESNSDVDDSESSYLDQPDVITDRLYGDRSEFFKHTNQYEDDTSPFNESYSFKLIDQVYFNDSVNINESTANEKLYPVYVMIMHSGTVLANAIKVVTKSNYSHSVVSFDSSMTKMYSFGRKFESNPIVGTFTTDSINSKFYKDKEIPYALYVVPSTKTEIELMKKRLNFFVDNNSKFKYDFIGLFKNYLGISDNPEYKWFCSRFVADILNAGKPDDKYVKDPSLMRPEDFRFTNFAVYLTGGNLNQYSQELVDKLTAKVLRTEELKRMRTTVSVNETLVNFPRIHLYTESVMDYQLGAFSDDQFDSFTNDLTTIKYKNNPMYDYFMLLKLNNLFNMNLQEKLDHSDNFGMEDELFKLYYVYTELSKANNIKTSQETRDAQALLYSTFDYYLNKLPQDDSDYVFKSAYQNSKYADGTFKPYITTDATGKVINIKF